MPIGGTSYQPTTQPMSQQGGAMRSITPQEAVRILSLRLPKNPQNSPIPNALLTSAGGGATSNLTQLLQALMQASARPGGDGTKEMVEPFGPGATFDPVPREEGRSFTPRVRPGDEGREPVPEPSPIVPEQEDSPLFDQGIPGPIRNMPRKPFALDMVQPLF